MAGEQGHLSAYDRDRLVRAAPLILLFLFVAFLLWLMDDLGPGW